MTRTLPWAVLALVVAGSVYGYTEIRASERAAKERASRATDRADSLSAVGDSLHAAHERLARQYSEYASESEARRDSLAARVASLTSEAGDAGERAAARTERLQGTLDSLLVDAPSPLVRQYARRALVQLDSVRTSHRRQITMLREAIAVGDSINASLRRQLAKAEAAADRCGEGWRQCRVALDSTRIAVERWQDIADPGWLEQLAKCLPETGAKLAAVGGATLVDERAGAGAGALLMLDMALGGPC